MNLEHFRSWDAIITKRYAEPVPFPDPTDPPSVDPATCPYDAYAINTDEPASIERRLPDRRITTTGRVVPANVGDPCKIVYNGKEFFLYVAEGIPFKEACDS